ncbi:XdhC family protein [Alkalihalobacillus sp. 1P02AB]|uniref:XdhC family protein n=1 Tax=Alkalihalobacillus sp. 1P02AB TaxID=3132260 RepID=UPI0039A610E2
MNETDEILNKVTDSKQPKVLATIIEVVGSSYRKEGAMMLIMEDGTHVGLLSGGCLENDLAERAAEVRKKQTTQTIVYDMSAEDDLSFGQGKGCSGTITVLLEPINPPLEEHLKKVKSFLNNGIPVLHIKKLSPVNTVSDYAFISDTGHLFGEWDKLNHELIELKKQLKQEKDGLVSFKNSDEHYYIQVLKPKPRLIVFGAGPDVRPLVTFAAKSGFKTTVTDWRPAFCEPAHFPEADKIILDFPVAFISEFSFSPNDSVIVMTHNFEKDQQILNQLLQTDLQYLGVLGPKKRTAKLLNEEKIPNKLHSPLGLSIGAIGPEEIAISILADVIKHNRTKNQQNQMNLFNERLFEDNVLKTGTSDH